MSGSSAPRRAELTVPVDVNAPAEAVWRTVTDWPGQGEWMLGTRVEVDGPGDGRHLGARLRAVTGVGPLGFTDTMEIVGWDPVLGARRAGRMDPLNLQGAARPAKDGEGWDYSPATTKAKGEKLSEIGHGNIAPNPQHGGVTISSAQRPCCGASS